MKMLSDMGGQRRMDRLFPDERNATVTQITTDYSQVVTTVTTQYNQGMHNTPLNSQHIQP